MGGYGSGRPETVFNYTVEDSHTLSISSILRYRIGDVGSISWSRAGRPSGSIGYFVDLNKSFVRLIYTWDKTEKMDYRVSLIKTYPNFGGVRWWFVCPASGCGKMVRKLYGAPGSRYFFCRTCQNLTYTSCRESHRYDKLHERIAKQAGVPVKVVKNLFR